MSKNYTVERNHQILISLLKQHGIKNIVVSPGATNVVFVGSAQQDSFFKLYSCVDERAAAYMACGLARETGEPVALSCTGATASRNYAPGLTEAYYSNLPVLAITSTQAIGRIGHLIPQVIDRSNCFNDLVKRSYQINPANSDEDEWAINVDINEALLELRRNGGGPVHINLTTTYNKDFSVKDLPTARCIKRYISTDRLPDIKGKKIVVCIGEHQPFSDLFTKTIEQFCEKYNAIVAAEHISNYKGKYLVNPFMIMYQDDMRASFRSADLMIHLGTVEGLGAGNAFKTDEVWRVHPDGEIRDRFRKLTSVFEMQEEVFFKHYVERSKGKNNTSYFNEWNSAIEEIETKIPELPFSNVWIGNKTINRIPRESTLYLGILNSVRTWSLTRLKDAKGIKIFANTGGFGIDGTVSTLLGASLSNPRRLYFGVMGDLAFFYDMNSLGNRHISSNIRIMIINNGRGIEFRLHDHPANNFGDNADEFMAAARHFGNKSPMLVKEYSENLGFTYYSASSKEEFLENLDAFVNPEQLNKPIVFEVFLDYHDESKAVEMMHHIETNATGSMKSTVKNLIGDKGVATIKKIVGRT